MCLHSSADLASLSHRNHVFATTFCLLSERSPHDGNWSFFASSFQHGPCQLGLAFVRWLGDFSLLLFMTNLRVFQEPCLSVQAFWRTLPQIVLVEVRKTRDDAYAHCPSVVPFSASVLTVTVPICFAPVPYLQGPCLFEQACRRSCLPVHQ